MAGAPAFCFLLFASSSRNAEPRVFIIEIDRLAFGPAPEGLRAREDECGHFPPTASATDGSFDIDLLAGTTGQTTLRRTRVVTFCCFHPGMNGRCSPASSPKYYTVPGWGVPKLSMN